MRGNHIVAAVVCIALGSFLLQIVIHLSDFSSDPIVKIPSLIQISTHQGGTSDSEGQIVSQRLRSGQVKEIDMSCSHLDLPTVPEMEPSSSPPHTRLLDTKLLHSILIRTIASQLERTAPPSEPVSSNAMPVELPPGLQIASGVPPQAAHRPFGTRLAASIVLGAENESLDLDTTHSSAAKGVTAELNISNEELLRHLLAAGSGRVALPTLASQNISWPDGGTNASSNRPKGPPPACRVTDPLPLPLGRTDGISAAYERWAAAAGFDVVRGCGGDVPASHRPLPFVRSADYVPWKQFGNWATTFVPTSSSPQEATGWVAVIQRSHITQSGWAVECRAKDNMSSDAQQQQQQQQQQEQQQQQQPEDDGSNYQGFGLTPGGCFGNRWRGTMPLFTRNVSRHLPAVVPLCDQWCRGYFHWTSEHLPRAALVAELFFPTPPEASTAPSTSSSSPSPTDASGAAGAANASSSSSSTASSSSSSSSSHSPSSPSSRSPSSPADLAPPQVPWIFAPRASFVRSFLAEVLGYPRKAFMDPVAVSADVIYYPMPMLCGNGGVPALLALRRLAFARLRLPHSAVDAFRVGDASFLIVGPTNSARPEAAAHPTSPASVASPLSPASRSHGALAAHSDADAHEHDAHEHPEHQPESVDRGHQERLQHSEPSNMHGDHSRHSMHSVGPPTDDTSSSLSDSAGMDQKHAERHGMHASYHSPHAAHDKHDTWLHSSMDASEDWQMAVSTIAESDPPIVSVVHANSKKGTVRRVKRAVRGAKNRKMAMKSELGSMGKDQSRSREAAVADVSYLNPDAEDDVAADGAAAGDADAVDVGDVSLHTLALEGASGAQHSEMSTAASGGPSSERLLSSDTTFPSSDSSLLSSLAGASADTQSTSTQSISPQSTSTQRVSVGDMMPFASQTMATSAVPDELICLEEEGCGWCEGECAVRLANRLGQWPLPARGGEGGEVVSTDSRARSASTTAAAAADTLPAGEDPWTAAQTQRLLGGHYTKYGTPLAEGMHGTTLTQEMFDLIEDFPLLPDGTTPPLGPIIVLLPKRNDARLPRNHRELMSTMHSSYSTRLARWTNFELSLMRNVSRASRALQIAVADAVGLATVTQDIDAAALALAEAVAESRKAVVEGKAKVRVIFVDDLFGRLPVVLQVLLFNRADFVVGPHGANLSNLMFMRHGAHLLEYVPGLTGNMCYYSLAVRLGIRYHMHINLHVGQRDSHMVNINEIMTHVADVVG